MNKILLVIFIFFEVILCSCQNASSEEESFHLHVRCQNDRKLSYQFCNGYAYTTAASDVRISGKLSFNINNERFIIDRLVGGLYPKRYKYFLIRDSIFPEKFKIDIVFFNDDGIGEFVGFPSCDVALIDEKKTSFGYKYIIGGDASPDRNGTYLFTASPKIDDNGCYLLMLIEDDCDVSFMGLVYDHTHSSVNMMFLKANLSAGVLKKAYDISYYNSMYKK